MLMSRLSSLVHKLPMLMFMLILASQVRTGATAIDVVPGVAVVVFLLPKENNTHLALAPQSLLGSVTQRASGTMGQHKA